MRVTCFTVGAFHVNTYLLQDEQSNKSAIVDTGESADLITHLLSLPEKPDIDKILLTHGQEESKIKRKENKKMRKGKKEQIK
jgi:glyoxylase-like metal-dependent hydrolase (beta-lactamase superfamily II)